MKKSHASDLSTWTLATVAAVAMTTACDASDRDPEDVIEAADTDDLDDSDDAATFDDSDEDWAEANYAASGSQRSGAAPAYLEIPFDGVCGYEDGSAMGTLELLVYDTQAVRGIAHYSWLLDSYPLSATLGMDGAFSARQLTTVGPCAFAGEVDLVTMTSTGTWTCGSGCAGTWSTLEP